MKVLILVLSWCISLSAANCHHGTTFFPRTLNEIPIADFSFIGMTGPLAWDVMHADNYLCGIGNHQSPIDIYTGQTESISGSDLRFDVQPYPDGAEFINIGSQVEVIANGTMCRDGKDFDLIQFHFHGPSEHLIDSEFYSLEMHFVFQAEDEEIAVVGIMVEVSAGNDCHLLFENIFQYIDDIKSPGTSTGTGPLDFKDVQTHLANTVVYQYSGSYTVPPCTEGVTWLVAKDPIFIQIDTFRKVKSIMKFNSRYTQNNPGGVNLLDNARSVRKIR